MFTVVGRIPEPADAKLTPLLGLRFASKRERKEGGLAANPIALA